ncbi:hypothetical protein JL09_g5868, partial [Pichia kudriavzevii]
YPYYDDANHLKLGLYEPSLEK